MSSGLRCVHFAELSDARLTSNPRPRYDIAPTQKVAGVLDEQPDELTGIRCDYAPELTTTGARSFPKRAIWSGVAACVTTFRSR